MFINVFIPQLKQHTLHTDHYIKQRQTAGNHFRPYSSSTAQTSGEEVLVMPTNVNADIVD